MTLRQLWAMACGRREEMRIHAITQAALVWVPDIDTDDFVRTGSMGEAKRRGLDPELQANVDRQIAGIMANGGKLIVG